MASWIERIILRMFRLMRKLRLWRMLRLGTSTGMFLDYFKGFERSRAVLGIFGDRADEVLKNLRVEFILLGYMGVDDNDGHLMVNERYLASGDRTDIYLDVIHELCHVKQHLEGRELFDEEYDYSDNPTEVEAYRYTVKEAKRLGLSDERILSYLQTEWMSHADLMRLVKNMGIDLHVTDK
ncbi:hypothetical protein MUP77_15660 [Candidatus Bathyarchaeota archaeon]|nr:hypothetical protein [Candidatus Bathyarchaeota archaeon]